MRTIELRTFDDEGYELVLDIPARGEVCWRCDGEGTHVNPAIDGNGITEMDRMDWADDDFMDDYRSGVYDIRCDECHGERILWVPDESRARPEDLAAWRKHEEQEYEYQAMVLAEQRMGA